MTEKEPTSENEWVSLKLPAIIRLARSSSNMHLQKKDIFRGHSLSKKGCAQAFQVALLFGQLVSSEIVQQLKYDPLHLFWVTFHSKFIVSSIFQMGLQAWWKPEAPVSLRANKGNQPVVSDQDCLGAPRPNNEPQKMNWLRCQLLKKYNHKVILYWYYYVFFLTLILSHSATRPVTTPNLLLQQHHNDDECNSPRLAGLS